MDRTICAGQGEHIEEALSDNQDTERHKDGYNTTPCTVGNQPHEENQKTYPQNKGEANKIKLHRDLLFLPSEFSDSL